MSDDIVCLLVVEAVDGETVDRMLEVALTVEVEAVPVLGMERVGETYCVLTGPIEASEGSGGGGGLFATEDDCANGNDDDDDEGRVDNGGSDDRLRGCSLETKGKRRSRS